MNKGKETASRRRTIAVSVPLTASVKEKPQSSGGIASFFFGQKTKTNTTSTATATLLSSKNNEALNKSNSDSAKSGKLSRPSSLSLFRANSNASVNSIASKNSVSSMGSFSNSIKGSNSPKSGAQDSPSLIPRTMSSNDELEKAEHMAIQVSMKLNLWEADTRPKSITVTKKTKRSLNRDNSTGSNVSNISNISNNSNISILSNGSNDSRPTSMRSHGSASPKNAPSPFNAAAAAAASRERFFGTPSPTPSMLAAEAAAATADVTNNGADHAHHLHAASHELLLSSGENSPQLTARTESNSSADNTIAGTIASTIVGDIAVPVPVTVQVPVPVKPSLKKSVAMEPLPNKREGLQRARNSWVATVTEGIIRPKMVKFTSSTKSMGELLMRETSREGKENLIVSAFMQVRSNGSKAAGAESEAGAEVEATAAPAAPSKTEDILIEGATLVEETEEEAADLPLEPPASSLAPAVVAEEESALEVEGAAPSEALAVEAPPTAPAPAECAVQQEKQKEQEQRRESPLALEVQETGESTAFSASAPASAPASPVPVPGPSPANPAKVALRHTTPNSNNSAGNGEGAGLERHGSGMLVMPPLSPVPIVHKVVTPARVEFVEVKLKHTDSALSMALGSPNSIVNNSEGASAGDSLMEEAVDGDAEQPHASLEDPRLPLAELVRRNAVKQYEGLCIKELEVYLTDEEFVRTFRMTRESFYDLPLWRQHNQKRSVGLF